MIKVESTLEILEGCASLPMEGHGREWQELMRVLQLPLGHWEAVKLVLDQGRWRKATDMVRYIRSAAGREWRKGRE